MRWTKMRRACATAPALVAAGILLAAASQPALALDTVKVGTPEASAYMFSVLDVGIGAGIFKKYGLAVDKINFGGGAKLQQAVTAGSVDLTVSGSTDLAYIAKGVPERAVAATAGAPVDMAVIVRTDGSIKSVADLKGKTIGVTSPTSLTSWLALDLSRRQGWGPDGIRRAYVGGMASEVAGLLVKNVDAIVGPVEGGYLLEAKGEAKPLVTFGSITPFIAHIVYASDAMVKDHPGEIRRFLRAWFATVTFMRAHKAETLRLTEPVTHLPPAVAAKVYDLETPALSLTGRFDPKAVAIIMQSFVDLGLLAEAPQAKPLYTEKFLP